MDVRLPRADEKEPEEDNNAKRAQDAHKPVLYL